MNRIICILAILFVSLCASAQSNSPSIVGTYEGHATITGGSRITPIKLIINSVNDKGEVLARTAHGIQSRCWGETDLKGTLKGQLMELTGPLQDNKMCVEQKYSLKVHENTLTGTLVGPNGNIYDVVKLSR